jgi:predicted MFS family arabinose efflux permease
MNPNPPPALPVLTRSVVITLAVTCGIGIGSAYYAQPLLPLIGRTFGVADEAMGSLPMATQVGIAFGVLLLLPLGDVLDPRKLILAIISAHLLTLAAVALSPTIGALHGASLALGLTTVTPYLIPAFAARLAPPERRGQVTGLMAQGIFAGILLARSASAALTHVSDWRTIYVLAFVAMLVMAILFGALVPGLRPSPSASTLPYVKLVASLGSVFRQQSRLRLAALTQGLLFGAFNVFWITLAFQLETPPFDVPGYVAGLFGIIGLVGAFAAPLFGSLADRKGGRFAVRAGTLVALSAWVVFALFGNHLAGLIVGVILLDLGTTACHVSNQTIIYQLGADIRSRVTTVYILGLFVGAAVLSPLAMWVWAHAGWIGVCALGGGATLIAVAANFAALIKSRATECEVAT